MTAGVVMGDASEQITRRVVLLMVLCLLCGAVNTVAKRLQNQTRVPAWGGGSEKFHKPWTQVGHSVQPFTKLQCSLSGLLFPHSADCTRFYWRDVLPDMVALQAAPKEETAAIIR